MAEELASVSSNITPEPAKKSNIMKLVKVALFLLFVTAIEFVFAFNMERGLLLTSIFVGLTLVKAFYIMGEFMHLKYEVKALIWAILIPTIFLVWLLIALGYEGDTTSMLLY